METEGTGLEEDVKGNDNGEDDERAMLNVFLVPFCILSALVMTISDCPLFSKFSLWFEPEIEMKMTPKTMTSEI